MNADELERLLSELAAGELTVSEVQRALLQGPFRDNASEFAHLDHHRALRQGMAETVFAPGKTVSDLLQICTELAQGGHPVLITRLHSEQAAALTGAFPGCRANERARTVTLNPRAPEESDSDEVFVAIVSAGTSDLPVAEEAAEVCMVQGVRVRKFPDVGVAGLHRIAGCVADLRLATATIIVAGMEGALPSVVAGLLDRPVFAVPTSVGYGASFGGIAALLAMLNSCAPGVAVFNIDNGYSAGVAASRVAILAKQAGR